MRRRREPRPADRLVGGGVAILIVGFLVYIGYYVVNFNENITPVRPHSRPASVPDEAVWYGNRGYKEGSWVACAATNQVDLYTCHTWSDAGRSVGTAHYSYVGEGRAPEQLEIERHEWRTVYLRGGGRLEYVVGSEVDSASSSSVVP